MGEEAMKVKNTGSQGWGTKLEGAGNEVMGWGQRKDEQGKATRQMQGTKVRTVARTEAEDGCIGR